MERSVMTVSDFIRSITLIFTNRSRAGKPGQPEHDAVDRHYAALHSGFYAGGSTRKSHKIHYFFPFLG